MADCIAGMLVLSHSRHGVEEVVANRVEYALAPFPVIFCVRMDSVCNLQPQNFTL